MISIKYRVLVAFDIEGTLVKGEYLAELARLNGHGQKPYEITIKGINGKMKWEDSLYERVEMVKGVHREDAQRVADNLPLMDGAEELIRWLYGDKEVEFIPVGISGGFDLVADRVGRELKLKCVKSNRFTWDDKNRIAGIELYVTSDKGKIIDEILKEIGPVDKIIAIGDGANDLKMFERADFKIAFDAQEEVRKKADVAIDRDLKKVKKTIEIYKNQIISSGGR